MGETSAKLAIQRLVLMIASWVDRIWTFTSGGAPTDADQ